ncbi:dihydroneopterin aldolase [Helicobacter mehlei]|uniref:FolB domain-containing protein n=1 Tax=Helicobacter mehlei TaxID=2316080 RepID=A0A553V2W6_9HELI|nr:dihydroneopterin aldolase [Helicobacter mehlei]TSA86581.1 FolB domain-containing protein [Helicobacter mehlei]
MTLLIENYQLDVLIGTMVSEQTTPQPILINLQVEYNYPHDHKGKDYLDYMDLLEVVQNKFATTQYQLLEQALEEITAWLKICFPAITHIDMEIRKPQACQKALVGARLAKTFEA